MELHDGLVSLVLVIDVLVPAAILVPAAAVGLQGVAAHSSSQVVCHDYLLKTGVVFPYFSFDQPREDLISPPVCLHLISHAAGLVEVE